MQWRKPFSEELKTLSRELEELGGGTHSRPAELHTILRIIPPRLGQSPLSQVVAQPQLVTVSQCTRTGLGKSQSFQLSDVFGPDLASKQVRDLLFSRKNKHSAVRWVLAGFNASVITYGEVDSGKSTLLYSDETNSVLYSLKQLFKETDLGLAIGVAFWELTSGNSGEQLVDLLNPASKSETCVGVHTLEQAEQVYTQALKNSKNFKQSRTGKFAILNNRGHIFTRITVYNQGTVSNLHIVDLAGYSTDTLPIDIKQQLGSDESLNLRRVSLFQFKSILYELANSTCKNVSQILATKKSKLAQSLAPMIGGNSKTYLLFTLREGGAYLDTVKLLELAKASMNVCVPCVKITDVPRRELGFVSFNDFEHTVRVKPRSISPRYTPRQTPKRSPKPSPKPFSTVTSHPTTFRSQFAEMIQHFDTPSVARPLTEPVDKKIELLREETAYRLSLIEDLVTTKDFNEVSVNTKKTINQLKRSLKTMNDEIKAKEKENTELKRTLSEWSTAQNTINSLNAKIRHLTEQLQKTKEYGLHSHQLSEELAHFKSENEYLKQEVAVLMQENAQLAQEVHKQPLEPTSTLEGAPVDILNKLQAYITQNGWDVFNAANKSVASLQESLADARIRERDLLNLLEKLQGQLEQVDRYSAQETNKLLRKSILSTLL